MQLTIEQQAIVREAERIVQQSLQAMRVPAFAGTGKTSTLIEVAKALAGYKILYVAFNRSTADEARTKFPKNTDCRTAHSLAYRATIGHFGKDRNTFSTMMIVRDIQDSPIIRPITNLLDDRKAAAFAVFQTITRFCQGARSKIGEMHVPTAFKVRIPEQDRKRAIDQMVQTAQAMWNEISRKDSRIHVNPDIYLKYWALTNPRLPYDVIMFDEAQDANPVMLYLIMRQKAQQIYVGDSHQQIYSFRGAIDAMDKVPGEELPLTKSWRFGPQIADWANQILLLLGEQRMVVGGGPEGRVLDGGGHSDSGAVLCRGNAGVVRETVMALNRGSKVAVVGGTWEAVKLMESAYQLFCGGKPNHPELGIFSSWGEFIEYSETDEGASMRPIIRLVEEYEDGIPDLCQRLKERPEGEIYKNEADADIVISTAHKAKGREWDYVRFSDDFPPLVVEDDKGDVKLNREEANLVYVSITRAMKELNLNGYGKEIKHFCEMMHKAVVADTVAVEEPASGDEPAPEDPVMELGVAEAMGHVTAALRLIDERDPAYNHLKNAEALLKERAGFL